MSKSPKRIGSSPKKSQDRRGREGSWNDGRRGPHPQAKRKGDPFLRERAASRHRERALRPFRAMIGRDVFINCPFSADYQLSFQAIVFTIVRSGFKPRCARENDDGGEVRIDKICRIIRDCPYSVHDLSMTELDAASGLPRFNMPLELGPFLAPGRPGLERSGRRKSSSSIGICTGINRISRTLRGKIFTRTAASFRF